MSRRTLFFGALGAAVLVLGNVLLNEGCPPCVLT